MWPICYHDLCHQATKTPRQLAANGSFHGNTLFPWPALSRACLALIAVAAYTTQADMNRQRAEHRQSIDLARFMAAFGVVVAHANASSKDWVGHLSLGLFLILTSFLAVQSMQRANGSYPWFARARRLVLPWLFWSAFFRVLDLAFSDDPGRFTLLREPSSLLIGSAIQLWFLPFVMLAMCLIEPAGRWITTARALAAASVGLVPVSLLLFWALGYLAMPEPLPQWAFALPLYAYGILVAFGHQQNRMHWPFVGIAIVSGVSFWVSREPWALQVVVAATVFEIFWRLSLRHRILPRLGKAAFGIYLIHPFFMLVVYKVLGANVPALAAACLAFAMSWAATMILQRLPGLRRVV